MLFGFVFADESGRTIKRKMIERRLGTLARADLDAVDRELRRSLAP